MKPPAAKQRFDTLDALRFFAFLRVFTFHLPLPAFPLYSVFKRGGDDGVFFFFVLSSFLISWLLFQEHSRNGKISLGRFYLRRTLRIWPLYYLMAAFAFATPFLLNYLQFPHRDDGYIPDWRFTFAFLGNYESMIKHGIPNASPLGPMWSLCVEEHFYLLWGCCFIFLPFRWIPRFLAGTIVLAPVFRLLYYHHHLWFMDLPTNLDFFSYGGLAAWLLFQKKERVENWVRRIPRWFTRVLALFVIAVVFAEPRFLDSGFGEIFRPVVLGPVFEIGRAHV
jgi:peptidoglycan/LPS O-acetylase OafA/YrhL